MCHGDTYISKPQQKKIFFTKKYFVAKKAKDYDTNWLRNAVSDYVLASPQKVKHLKDNPRGFLRIRVPREDNNTLHHGYMDMDILQHAYCMKYIMSTTLKMICSS